MGDSAFFDTNILVYIHDGSAPLKQTIAVELTRRYFSRRIGVISTQVLQEFFSAVTRKGHLNMDEARSLVVDYSRLRVVSIQPPQILHAIDLMRYYKLSIWDCLILAAAKAAAAATVYSEDLGHEAVYDGVTVRNPFLEAGRGPVM